MKVSCCLFLVSSLPLALCHLNKIESDSSAEQPHLRALNVTNEVRMTPNFLSLRHKRALLLTKVIFVALVDRIHSSRRSPSD
jgi:hypothetical protein